MAETSHISWTDGTFNPWWGCTKISPACDNCYAERDSKRYGHAIWGKESPRRFFSEKHWEQPEKWNKAAEKEGVRRRIFCASMADVFEDRRDLDVWRRILWALILRTPMLDWLLLTKRPMNIKRLYPKDWQEVAQPNVWLGATVEAPEYLWRIGELTSVAAVVHFLSIEPLTSPIPELRMYLDHVEWVISGGESGPGARPQSPDAYRQIRDAAVSRGIPFHFKQWGEHNADLVRIGKRNAGSLLDGVDWKQFPVVRA